MGIGRMRPRRDGESPGMFSMLDDGRLTERYGTLLEASTGGGRDLDEGIA
jgi:hypothetical protein